ncbi:MAG TPA: DUF2147 domain-containing protein [Sphingomonas sp.]|jgi:uncharacterized protein (DUF2147 family)|nr:DUF2147 domain-containing protein [Sphingomonas sp.]
MIAILLAAAVAASSPAPSIDGVWHNPRNSVAVRTGACGQRLCGWIVRASDKAKADARARGAPDLIGTALLRNYRRSSRNKFAGQVWVPDMGRAFGSTITVVDADTLSVKGCLVGGFICKSQLWRRD